MRHQHAALAVTLLLALDARAADPDPWFGADKAKHFAATSLLSSGGDAGAALFTPEERNRLVFGGILAMSVGVGKELWDLAGHGDPSWRDLTWDGVGTVFGLAVAWLVDEAWRHVIAAPVPSAP
jgi:putative lipoprotein